MTYTHSEEVECTFGENETSVELFCDVECTFHGSPGSGPSWDDPGSPPEGAEYESGIAYFDFGQETNGKTGIVKLTTRQLTLMFGEAFMNGFYERAEEQADEKWDHSPDDYPEDDGLDD